MTDKPIKATLDSSDDSVKTQKPILIQLDDIPTPEAGDAGKALVVNAAEDGYELASGGGGESYDMVISSSITFESASVSSFTIESGTMGDIYTKLSSGEKVKILIYATIGTSSIRVIEYGTVSYVSSTETDLSINFSFIGQSRFYLFNATLYIYEGDISSYSKASVQLSV